MARPAPGASISVGATTVTYLPDGEGRARPEAFFPGSDWAAYTAYLDEEGRFPVSIGSFLIRAADRVVLVDLGIGAARFGVPGAADFSGGGLLDSLAAEGLAPADVDTVVFTHLHHDHVGWVTDLAPAPGVPDGAVPGGLTFPAARHLVAEAEWRHWTAAPGFPGPDETAVLGPLADAIGFVADGDRIAPGVTVLATPGHTPGHLSLVVTDPERPEAGRVVVLGDVMHCQVQVAESEWGFVFDDAPAEAAATREALLTDLEDERTLLAGGHFAGHVFGRVLPPVARRSWSSAA
jgi:glyoxylase-like metal-dependent hydrolase (beta-lactamase superfamily II)